MERDFPILLVEDLVVPHWPVSNLSKMRWKSFSVGIDCPSYVYLVLKQVFQELKASIKPKIKQNLLFTGGYENIFLRYCHVTL
jgi:hypothetical protein